MQQTRGEVVSGLLAVPMPTAVRRVGVFLSQHTCLHHELDNMGENAGLQNTPAQC